MAFLRKRRWTTETDVEPLTGTSNVATPLRTTGARQKSLRKLLIRSWSRGNVSKQARNHVQRNSNDNADSPPSYVKACSTLSQVIISELAHGDREETASQLSELSEESLLEAWTANDEVSLMDYHGIDRVRKHLEHRGKAFNRCTANKSKFYRDIVLSRELQSRARLLKSYKSKDEMLHQGLPVEAENSEYPSPTTCSELSLLRRVQGILLLEGHSLEAAWIALFYSTGHQSLYMVLDGLVKLGLSHSGIAPNIFYSLVSLLGLLMIRMNGYLWFWLGPDSYRLVKFEIHNRHSLQYWDAQVLSWFRHGKFKWINGYVSILGYYFLYIGMVYFYYSIAWIKLEAWSWKAYTVLEATMQQQMKSTTATGADLCDAMLEAKAWYRQGAQFLCHQWYTQEVPTLSILYDGSILLISAIAIWFLGGNLFAE